MLSVHGYVNAVAGFSDSPAVINGASDLLVAVFGEAGRHVRAAVGCKRLAPQRPGRTADGGGAMTEYRLSAEPTHSLWNHALPPRLTIAPGDTVHMSCLDASGGQVTPGASVEDFLAIDRTRIHALTGPVFVDGAEPGDVLEIQVRRSHIWAGDGRASFRAWAFSSSSSTNPFFFIGHSTRRSAVPWDQPSCRCARSVA